MKKLLFLVMVAFFSSAMNAQLVTSTTITKTKTQKQTECDWFMEVGLGTLGADYECDGIALDLGIGYRKKINEYLAWDILKIKAVTETSKLEQAITPKIMTGIRGTSPVLFGNMSAYGSINAGYGHWFSIDKGGFVYEIQIGVNITPKLYAGLVYENQNTSYWTKGEVVPDEYGSYYTQQRFIRNANVSFIGLKLGFKL